MVHKSNIYTQGSGSKLTQSLMDQIWLEMRRIKACQRGTYEYSYCLSAIFRLQSMIKNISNNKEL